MPLTVFMTTDAVGGVWQYSLDLAAELGARGIATILAVSGPLPSAAQRQTAEAIGGLSLLETGLPLDWTAAYPDQVASAAKHMAELATLHAADVIHLNSPALAACTEFSAPIIAIQHSCVTSWWTTVHGGVMPPDLAWRGALTSDGLRKADAVIAPTAAFAELTMRLHALSQLPHIVFNGRRRAHIEMQATGQLFAFTAGRLWDEGKNVQILDEAAASLDLPVRAAGPRKNPNGGEAHFANLICLDSISDETVAALLAQQPIYVSAALYEPFGLAVLEAAQAGCALILSDIPTFHELWHDVAIFVQPNDAKAFAEAIAEVAADPHRRRTLGQSAAQRAACYSLESMADSICGVYDKVLAARACDFRERAA